MGLQMSLHNQTNSIDFSLTGSQANNTCSTFVKGHIHILPPFGAQESFYIQNKLNKFHLMFIGI